MQTNQQSYKRIKLVINVTRNTHFVILGNDIGYRYYCIKTLAITNRYINVLFQVPHGKMNASGGPLYDTAATEVQYLANTLYAHTYVNTSN